MTRTRTSRPQTRRRGNAGVTLVEIVVTMALAGLLMGVAVSGWTSWTASRQHSGTAQEITSWLRQAQQRAVTEGGATCVQFDVTQGTWTLFRGACDSTSKVRVQGPRSTASPRVLLTSASFTGPAATTHPGVTFSARGTAWPGEVRVARQGSSRTYVIRVEGLTGRVSVD